VGSRELTIMTTTCHKHPSKQTSGTWNNGGEQRGNNENKSPVQQTLDKGASLLKSVLRPPSPPPCPTTKMPAIHWMTTSYEPKTKSSDVDFESTEE
jgi:hypothetical protein